MRKGGSRFSSDTEEFFLVGLREEMRAFRYDSESVLFMKWFIMMAALSLASAAHGQAPKAALGGLSFLLGEWSAGRGHVTDTGGTSTGTSSITTAAGGAVLLRRDRTNLFDAAGHPTGGFDQLMTIYAEGGGNPRRLFRPDTRDPLRRRSCAAGALSGFLHRARHGQTDFPAELHPVRARHAGDRLCRGAAAGKHLSSDRLRHGDESPIG